MICIWVMFIGIGGVSRSGKSTMAGTVRELYPQKRVVILSQDDFVFPTHRIPRIGGEIDWECPESMDFESFYNALVSAQQEADLVVGEGILVFYTPALDRLFNRKIFITITESEFRHRKITDHRWGAFPDWYIDHIWTSYERFGKIATGRSDVLYVNGEKPFMVKHIRRYINTGDHS